MQWDKAQLLESVDGDVEMLNDIVGLFKDTMLADLSKIEVAIKTSSFLVISDAAHSIKGAALTLGIDEISSLAEDLERDGKDEKMENIDKQYVGLRALYEELASELED